MLRWPVQIRGVLCGLACAALLAGETRGTGAARPQYGGVLRVEMRANAVTLNPRKWKAGSSEWADNERLAKLVFERLVSLDNYGRFQPELATEWSHDGAARRWQFTLRPGVKFSDGAPVLPGEVASALASWLPEGMQIAPVANGVTIQCAAPAEDLLAMLASGPYFVYRSDEKGGLLGTGPFVLENPAAEKSGSDGVPAAARLRFRFNELNWSGRPYVDTVEVTLGVPPLRAMLDLQLGKTDVAEISEDTARRGEQANVKLWKSHPLTLYALRFATPAKTENEKALREALSLSVDRNAMALVLLQKQAVAAPSFLPQWLSGYAFLFDTESNLERAKELRASLPANAVGATAPLHVAIDGGNDLLKLIAERVVVNARSAGLTLQTAWRTAAGRGAGDTAGFKAENEAQLIAWRYTSLSPREALRSLAGALKWEIPLGGIPADVEARYAWEKRMMDEKNLLPLVAVPDYAALGARVRNWAPGSWGEWRLADVWLDQDNAASPRDSATPNAAGAVR